MTRADSLQLDSLYRAHNGWLLGWLANRVRCRTLASDLAQETFCRLAEQPGLRFNEHPRRYLTTVARRLLIDDVRRRTTERCFLDAFALHMGDHAHPSPAQISEAVQELTAVVRLLNGLPPKACRAFLMSRLDGMGYGDIANELGVSVSMVKKYVAQALTHCYIAGYGCADE